MKKQVKFKILPRLLDHIGLAMYSSVPKAVSELVANSYNADAAEVYVDVHERNGTLKEIIIRDTGKGMSAETIEASYLALGYNKRNEKKHKRKRRPIGNKGIGKLAGLGIAKNMEISSVSSGTKTVVSINRGHFEDKVVDLSEIEFPMLTVKSSDPNGTVVTLTELLDHAQAVEISKLREFLTIEFGLTEDFTIFVNKQALSASDIDGEERKVKDTIPNVGTVTGKIKIAKQMKDVARPGLIIYVRGRAIEGPTLYDINTPSHHYRVANRIIGEINADFLDPDKPSDLLDSYIISTSRDCLTKATLNTLRLKNGRKVNCASLLASLRTNRQRSE